LHDGARPAVQDGDGVGVASGLPTAALAARSPPGGGRRWGLLHVRAAGRRRAAGPAGDGHHPATAGRGLVRPGAAPRTGEARPAAAPEGGAPALALNAYPRPADRLGVPDRPLVWRWARRYPG